MSPSLPVLQRALQQLLNGIKGDGKDVSKHITLGHFTKHSAVDVFAFGRKAPVDFQGRLCWMALARWWRRKVFLWWRRYGSGH